MQSIKSNKHNTTQHNKSNKHNTTIIIVVVAAIMSHSTNTNTNTNNEDELFFDRLRVLLRHTSDGDVVPRGATDGTNTISIRAGRGDSAFVVSYCKGRQLLLANVEWWPSGVSADGETIKIWFLDHSAGRDGYKRRFDLQFCDAEYARKFFRTYTSRVPEGRGGARLGYDEMVHAAIELEAGGMEQLGNAGTEEEGGGDAGQQSSDEGVEEEEGEGEEQHDEGVEEEDESANDQAQRLGDIVALEEMWGESQDLFHPTYPVM